MPPAGTTAAPVELDLMPSWRDPLSSRRLLRDGVGSILVHIAAAVIFFSLPDVAPRTAAPVVTPDLHRAIHIVAPRMFEPTQKAPNQGKISRELDVRSSVQTPQPQAPKFRPPSPPPGPVAQPAAAAPVIEPPKIEV